MLREGLGATTDVASTDGAEESQMFHEFKKREALHVPHFQISVRTLFVYALFGQITFERSERRSSESWIILELAQVLVDRPELRGRGQGSSARTSGVLTIPNEGWRD